MLLGDAIEEALKRANVTKELVETLLGPNCGCNDRKERLNELDAWARQVVNNRIKDSREYFDLIFRRWVEK